MNIRLMENVSEKGFKLKNKNQSNQTWRVTTADGQKSFILSLESQLHLNFILNSRGTRKLILTKKREKGSNFVLLVTDKVNVCGG